MRFLLWWIYEIVQYSSLAYVVLNCYVNNLYNSVRLQFTYRSSSSRIWACKTMFDGYGFWQLRWMVQSVFCPERDLRRGGGELMPKGTFALAVTPWSGVYCLCVFWFHNLLLLVDVQGLSLGKPQHRPEDGTVVEIGSDANSNSSDSNTFYEEDFSSSDDGSITHAFM